MRTGSMYSGTKSLRLRAGTSMSTAPTGNLPLYSGSRILPTQAPSRGQKKTSEAHPRVGSGRLFRSRAERPSRRAGRRRSSTMMAVSASARAALRAPQWCARRLASNVASRPVPPPRGACTPARARADNAGSVDTPKAFLEAISKTRRNLAENSSCVSAVGEDWGAMFRLSSEALKGAGVSPQDRKYVAALGSTWLTYAGTCSGHSKSTARAATRPSLPTIPSPRKKCADGARGSRRGSACADSAAPARSERRDVVSSKYEFFATRHGAMCLSARGHAKVV